MVRISRVFTPKCRSYGRYSSAWPIIAWKMKVAASWVCERCGRQCEEAPEAAEWDRRLTVHHLDGNRANCHRANLAVLCWKCHQEVQRVFNPASTFPYHRLSHPEPEWRARRRALYQQAKKDGWGEWALGRQPGQRGPWT